MSHNIVRNRFIIFSLFLFLPVISRSQSYQLVWSDEFDSLAVNTNEWVYEVNGDGGGNNELQYYTSRLQNSLVGDSKLKINAFKESYLGKAYTSARMHSKRSWQYGKVEARLKLPFGKGMWPAFWMLGSNIGSVGWPSCGEIDIMEMIGGTTTASGGDGRVFGTAHWNQSGHVSYGLSTALASGKLSDDFHTYSVVWDSKQIIWYFDNVQYCVISTQPTALNAFRAPFFIILNLAVGGSWPGSPDTSTHFPQTMEVDYVRVYQLSSTGVRAQTEPPGNFTLEQNFPNPFNPSTTIRYGLPSTSNVRITIYNALGQQIDELQNGEQSPGLHENIWNTREASGLYFYRITAVDVENPEHRFTELKKMQLLK